MERKRLMLAGGLIVMAGVMFVGLQKLNQPVERIITVPSAEPVAVEVEQDFVLVAIETLPRGRRITAEMLDWQQWPKEAISPGFISQESRPQAIDELVDSIVRNDIYSGEPINESKIVRAGDSGLMAALLSPGMRAVTTRVSADSAAGGFIMPGDRVDIIMTRQLPKQRDNYRDGNMTQYVATTVFENVKVLAMNQNYTTGPDSPAAMTGVSYATFELNQSDSELLEEAAKIGSISLTLRGLQPGSIGRSAAKTVRAERQESSTIVMYRDGQQTQVAIRGQ